MSENQFTIYQHPKVTKQGYCYKWYYYYYDQNGKKVQKACKNCFTREQAENYVAKLSTPTEIITRSNLVKDIAKDMYLPESKHMERRKQLGKSTYNGTVKESRRFVETIIKQWGNLQLQEIQPEMVMAFLFSINRSGKWKNKFIYILNEVYSEAMWYKCRVRKLELNKFKVNVKKADILTPTEIQRLFQYENFPSYQWYLMFVLCLAAGLRLGEVRAVRTKQIVFEKSLIIIDGFIQTDGTRTTYNKKGNPENPRLRIVYLNEIVLEHLRQWIISNNLQSDEYLFTKDNKPIRVELAESIFYKALQKAEIIPTPEPRPRNKRGQGRQKQIKKKIKCLDDRKIVPHSLRYTYVTMMLNHVTTADLMPMTGHTTEANVDYYHRKVLDMTVASLPKNLREATNTMFQWELLKEPLNPEIPQLELFDSVA